MRAEKQFLVDEVAAQLASSNYLLLANFTGLQHSWYVEGDGNGGERVRLDLNLGADVGFLGFLQLLNPETPGSRAVDDFIK